MNDTLVHTYGGLVGWVAVGWLLLRFLPDAVPHWLGRALYWVGIPIETFGLARRIDFSPEIILAPLMSAVGLAISGGAAYLVWQLWQRQGWWPTLNTRAALSAPPPLAVDRISSDVPHADSATLNKALNIDGTVEATKLAVLTTRPTPTILATTIAPTHAANLRPRQGSFLLAAMLANTGFIGLAIAPLFVSPSDLTWAVSYNVSYATLGTYGLGVFCASLYGQSGTTVNWGRQVRTMLTVPSLWAFGLGLTTHSLTFPAGIEPQFHAIFPIVSTIALILLGIRLSQVQDWGDLRWAIAPTLIRTLLTPSIIALILHFSALSPSLQFTLVFMTGTPTAVMSLVLAEEHQLDRNLLSSSIALSTLVFLLTLPLWVVLYQAGQFS